MRYILILILFATSANAVEQARVDLFLKLVRDNGCEMDDATASKVLPANGFTREEVGEIEQILLKKSMIDIAKLNPGSPGGVFALTKAACKG
jgi:hypothetical protein